MQRFSGHSNFQKQVMKIHYCLTSIFKDQCYDFIEHDHMNKERQQQ